MKRLSHPILWILFIALVLRLSVALLHNRMAPYDLSGGDEAWYLSNGAGLVSGDVRGTFHGIKYDVEVMPGAAAYLVFIGLPQRFLAEGAATRFIFIVQALAGTATCWLAYRIAWRVTNDVRVGWVTAAVLALSPMFIISVAQILTEAMFIFWLTAGLWLYTEAAFKFTQSETRLRWYWLGSGALLGLATLTRAAAIAFPLLLVAHLLVIGGRGNWRRALGYAVLLLLAYGVMTSTWTVYKWVNFGRIEFASTQMLPTLWRGAVEGAESPQTMDAMLMADEACDDACRNEEIPGTIYAEQIKTSVLGDLGGFIQKRVTELVSANLLPHGAIELGGESLRGLFMHWLQDDFSLAGLLRLINGDNFWLKLLLYVFHFAGLIGGIAGIWLLRRRWRLAFIPFSYILYTNVIHLALLAVPRYIFPTQLYWWIFASAALVWLWERRPYRPSVPIVSDEAGRGWYAERSGN
jgi:4-amino-4-deoxy-L-arabinose transferase-like glycosyltransferase